MPLGDAVGSADEDEDDEDRHDAIRRVPLTTAGSRSTSASAIARLLAALARLAGWQVPQRRQKAELLRVSCTLSARKRFIFDREITRRLAGHLDQIDEVEFWGIVERALREVRHHVSRGSVR